MRILGVDPGLTGALALFRYARPTALLDVVDMPATKSTILEAALAGLIRDMEPDHAYVELVHSMPAQGVASTFTFGRGYGTVLGVLAGLNIPTTLIPPQKWGALVQLPRGEGGSRVRVCQLFPAQAAQFSRVKDHGRADAALIALAGWRLISPF